MKLESQKSSTKNNSKILNFYILSVYPQVLFYCIIDLSIFKFECTGLKFAGTRDGNAQELLYKYVVYFLNEVCPWFCDSDVSEC